MSIRDEAYLRKPLSPFIVDAHTHLAPYYRMGWHQKPDMTSVRSMMETYDRLGVNCCVTAPHMIIDSMSIWGNEFAAQAIAEFPGRIYGYISIAPFEGMETAKQNIRRFGAHPGFVGFKFLGGYNGDYTEPEYRYALDFANEARCPVLCHTWNNSPSLATLRDIAEAHPDLNILCAHQGGGSKTMTDLAVRIMKELPNFQMEICGSLWNEYGIEDIAGMIGADRVVFGTDAVNLDARFDFGRVVFSPLSDSEKRLILGENFLRLLEKSQMGKIQR